MYELFKDLAIFTMENGGDDFVEVWNGWIQSRGSIPINAIPILTATLRELVKMDRSILSEIVELC